MVIKNVPKKSPTDQPQVQISGVRDGEVYNYGVLSQKLQRAATVDAGDEFTGNLDPVTPPTTS